MSGRIGLTLAACVLVIAASCSSSEPRVSSVADEAAPTAIPTAVPAPTASSAPTAEQAPTSEQIPPPEPTAPEPTATLPTTAPPDPTPPPDPVPTAEPAGDLGPPECRLEQGDRIGDGGTVSLETEVVVDGLEVPWGLAFLPSGDLLVTERPGRLRLVSDGELIDDPVLDIAVSIPDPLFNVDRLGSEGGLLGLLLHPDFEANRQFYIFYNVLNDDGEDIARIERFVLAADGRSAGFERLIIDELPAGVHHQGGRMHIGPDAKLYVGVGAFDPWEAQDPATLAGKLLRLELDGGIPVDNPDPTSYVFASGIRNTQGFDWFDNEHLIVVDHGPSGLELDMPELRGFDEVNVVTAGDNLGWPATWGCDEVDGLVSPVLSWERSVPPTGGIFYRGDLIPEWTGSFLFTTVGGSFGQHLHRVEFVDGNPYVVESHEIYLDKAFGRLRTISADADGALYIMTSNCDPRGACPSTGDAIIRITPG